jgi:hypothetical protein
MEILFNTVVLHGLFDHKVFILVLTKAGCIIQLNGFNKEFDNNQLCMA